MRVADLLTFLAVRRYGSLTGASRELRVTASQVSKAINRLEGQVNRTLLARSSRGVVLSNAAERLVPHFEVAIAQLRQVRREDDEELTRELTLAAPSYLLSGFLTPLARALPAVRLRALQLGPAAIRAQVSQNIFDLAFSVGDDPMPKAWKSELAGYLKKSLFATPALAQRLGSKVNEQMLREVAFISPIYSDANGQFLPVDDGCPLPYGERRLGHEAQTVAAALELAACTHQLVFGPVIAARAHLARGELVEVPVEGWRLSDPLYLCCNIDRVAARVQRTVLQMLQAGL